MRPQSLALALVLAFAADATLAASTLPPASGKTTRPDEERYVRRRPSDCHRDVRTHRINGAMVTHRHVGDWCEIRVVRKLNSF